MSGFTMKPGGGNASGVEQCARNIQDLERRLAAQKAYLSHLEGRAGTPAAAPVQEGKKEKKKEKDGKKEKVTEPAAPPKPKEKAPRDWKFDTVITVGEECQEEEELATLLHKKKDRIRYYDGFEPSGRMHIAQGILKTINVNKCTKANGHFVFWVADWFALMNDKMGGSLERIRTVGEYLVEVWKAAGMDLENVEFIWSSDAINKQAETYWLQMLDIARQFTLARITKCCQIMGRQEGTLTCAQILYPLMQCTDIFFLKADVCQLGLDQRKVNMLARDYCDAAGKKGAHKPIILSHHMMSGLLKDQEKMSKSDPRSAIFMEDSVEMVEEKMQGAYCPVEPELLKKNPILDFISSIVFVHADSTFTAGGKTYTSRQEVDAALLDKSLSVPDLRKAAADYTNAKLEPVRKHFQENQRAKEILELVKEYKRQSEEEAQQPKKAAPKAELEDGAALFMVLPTQEPTLNQVLSVSEHAKKLAQAGKKVKVVLLDWIAYLLNVAGGDRKAITYLIDYTARWFKACLGDAQVEVVLQSKEILSNPDTYWIGVINCGRRLALKELGEKMGKDYEKGEGEAANEVIAGLMIQQQVLSANAKHVAPPIAQFNGVIELTGAKVLAVPDIVPCLKDGFLGVQPSCNGVYPVLAAPSIITLVEPEALFGAKVKKGFCTPEVAEGNPVLQLGIGLSQVSGQPLAIARKKEGDSVSYATAEELTAAFTKGDVHPGDLKPAVQAALKAVVANLRAGLTKDKEFTQCETQVGNMIKKLAKEAGKKK
eukprot:TRINITY_DN3216_c0_g1_i1.p1 TRINITY_DN3216_c0_g1~~TRINITY_DN3216_c0_g1_i1.p1  ORF type:complete len:769 (+),score=380.55 TRINITY_DN3216_c0_g1_i1:82-2388(+)